jgi:serine/threonine-protein kinase
VDKLSGRTLGPYELGERLGSGGMGAVYRGWHRTLRRHRAVKVLPPILAADETFVERFQREAYIAAGLRHPNIVLIHDIGEADGFHYIAMELLEGTSLRQLIEKEGRLPPARALGLLDQLASALDYAHAQGVIHRDLKPANVVVGPDDQATLVDFGVARAAEGTALTSPGAIIGTADYMAPESVIGGESSAAADRYALGVLAFELLTGRRPFQAPDASRMMYAHAHTPPPSPRALRPDLPAAVEAVLLRQLAKDPAERYPSAGGFVAALRSAAGPSALAMPVPMPGDGLALPERESEVRTEPLAQAIGGGTSPSATNPAVTAPERAAAPGRLRRVYLVIGAGLALVVLLALLSNFGGEIGGRMAEAVLQRSSPSPGTPSAQLGATATVAAAAVADNLARGAKRIFGPVDGSLDHDPASNAPKLRHANLNLRDFMVEARFYNPYSLDEGEWSSGFLIRDNAQGQNFRVYVAARKPVVPILVLLQSTGAGGPPTQRPAPILLPDVDVTPDRSNVFRIIVKGDAAYFYVNGEFQKTLDVSAIQSEGDIALATGLQRGTEVGGKTTRYEGFTVWSLP